LENFKALVDSRKKKLMGSTLAIWILGLVVERILLRFLYGKDHAYQLLFTFALVLIFGDLTRMVWGSNVLSVPVPQGLNGATDLGVVEYPSYLLFLSFAGVTIAAGLWFLTQKTRWGRQIRAATQDREMLAALGLNVPFIYASVFFLGSALAGLGRALHAPRIGLLPSMDATVIVTCFIIVIIGGLGSLWGALLGALIIGLYPKLTVFENMQAALIAHHRMEYRFFTLAQKLFRDEALELLAAVGMAEDADRVAGTLAYGRQKQLELAVGLASEPNFLLLDEPTAGMSGPETRQAIDLIARITGERKLTLLFTEHDMEVVFGIADRISVL
jgi:branched-subunit amino acid ABC-type transport system permease component